MAKLYKNGNTLRVGNIDSTYAKLPVGVYNLNVDNAGYYLTKSADFSLPEKIYGDTSVIDRWLKTYNDKKRNVGVLLSGLKGGGKTVTAKLLAIKANKPVITINQPYSGQDFFDFITDPILGDCVIFLDEFEKVYCSPKKSDDGNDSLLSLLDGPYETHHLFVFTVNETKINSNLINRPSRILYAKHYEGLNEEEIREIAEDKLVNKKHMDDLLRTAHKIFQLSFDILISIIDEVNRFDEPASKCIEYMNLTPTQTCFEVKQWYVEENGKVDFEYSGWGCDVISDENGTYCNVRFNYEIITVCGKETHVRTEYNNLELDIENLKKVSANTYELFDDELKTLFTLTEKNNNFINGYTKVEYYKPHNVMHEKLKIYVDNDGHYIKHTPEVISVNTIGDIVGYRIFENSELMKEKNMDSNPRLVKARNICDEKCCCDDECCCSG